MSVRQLSERLPLPHKKAYKGKADQVFAGLCSHPLVCKSLAQVCTRACKRATTMCAEEEGNNAGKGDYFVPWHIPFHRADAASVIRQACLFLFANDHALNLM